MFKKKKKPEPKRKKTKLEDMYDVTSSDVAEALARHDDIDVTTHDEKPEQQHESVNEQPIEPAVSDDHEKAEQSDMEPIVDVVETEPDQPEVVSDSDDEFDESVDPEHTSEDVIESEDLEEEPDDVTEQPTPAPVVEATPSAKQPTSTEVHDEETPDRFIWANSEEWEEQQAKRQKKSKKRRSRNKTDETPELKADEQVESPQVMFPVVEDDEEEREKVDLNSFFDASRNKSRKLKRKEKKRLSKKEQRRRKKRKDKKRTADDIKDKNIFKFRKKKYAKVEDFIAYLNDHYLDIDEVAQLILDDENFFGWISKKSGMFNQSLNEFREIKSKIEDE